LGDLIDYNELIILYEFLSIKWTNLWSERWRL